MATGQFHFITNHVRLRTCMTLMTEPYMPIKTADQANPLDVQVGGGHYKDLPIQPVEYIHANGIGYLAGNVVKYVTRHKAKGGEADVRKAIHYCQLILELEYGKTE